MGIPTDVKKLADRCKGIAWVKRKHLYSVSIGNPLTGMQLRICYVLPSMEQLQEAIRKHDEALIINYGT